MPRVYVRMSTFDRLMRHVVKDPETGCWVWKGKLFTGYGTTTIGFKADGTNRGAMAHRVMYELLVGPIPDGLDLDHQCHNRDKSCKGGSICLHRRCINPAHLEPATRQENLLRGVGVTATKAAQTHCIHGHLFNEENTRIKINGCRSCRQCGRDRQKVYKRRRREQRLALRG